MASASVSTQYKSFWGLKLNCNHDLFHFIIHKQEWKRFLGDKYLKFWKELFCRFHMLENCGRIRFQWNCRARSTTLLNTTFYWGSFLVNASECSAFFHIGLKASSIKLEAVQEGKFYLNTNQRFFSQNMLFKTDYFLNKSVVKSVFIRFVVCTL